MDKFEIQFANLYSRIDTAENYATPVKIAMLTLKMILFSDGMTFLELHAELLYSHNENMYKQRHIYMISTTNDTHMAYFADVCY